MNGKFIAIRPALSHEGLGDLTCCDKPGYIKFQMLFLAFLAWQ